MNTDSRLVFWGVLLFFLALLSGLLLVASPSFVVNPRGVLAGHLEGAMNGMFVILVGLFFNRVQLSAAQSAVCRGTLLYSAFGNWFLTTLAGILGTSESTPLAGAGHHAGAVAEQFDPRRSAQRGAQHPGGRRAPADRAPPRHGDASRGGRGMTLELVR